MDKILIGIVSKPQGIKGEVKILPLTDSPEVFCELTKIFIEEEEYKIISCRTGDGVYLALKGIADRNAAEELRGKEIFSLKIDVPKEDERWFVADIIGCVVHLDTGEEVGVVCDVTKRGSTDVFTTVLPDKKAIFPFLKEMIVLVDISQKKIVLTAKRFDEVVLYED